MVTGFDLFYPFVLVYHERFACAIMDGNHALSTGHHPGFPICYFIVNKTGRNRETKTIYKKGRIKYLLRFIETSGEFSCFETHIK